MVKCQTDIWSVPEFSWDFHGRMMMIMMVVDGIRAILRKADTYYVIAQCNCNITFLIFLFYYYVK